MIVLILYRIERVTNLGVDVVASYERAGRKYVVLEFSDEFDLNNVSNDGIEEFRISRPRLPRIPIPGNGIPGVAEGRYVTDKPEKKANIEEGWIVAFGREITETDFIQGGISAFFGGAAGVVVWAKQLIEESISALSESVRDKLSNEVKDAAIKFATEILEDLCNGKKPGEALKNVENIGFKAGIAQYQGKNQVKVLGSGWNTVSTTLAFQPYIGVKIN